jgi:hypothetical protein
MDRGDELWLPDGRVLPFRRAREVTTPGPRAAAPAARADDAEPRRHDRRRRPRSDADRGRVVDVSA